MGRRWHPASRAPPAVAAAVDGRTVAAGGFEVGWHCPRLRTIAVAAVSGIVAVDRERGETELETIREEWNKREFCMESYLLETGTESFFSSLIEFFKTRQTLSLSRLLKTRQTKRTGYFSSSVVLRSIFAAAAAAAKGSTSRWL